MMPMPDKVQNYMMMSASEMNGYTNLVFYRKRDTGDAEQDVVIKVRLIEIPLKIYRHTLPNYNDMHIIKITQCHVMSFW